MNPNEQMRDALEQVLDKIDDWRTDGMMEHWQYSQLFDIADTALALPRRNCDVGTLEEQAQRFNAFCKKQNNKCCVGRSKGECPVFRGYEIDCALTWAQMPYNEQEESKS